MRMESTAKYMEYSCTMEPTYFETSGRGFRSNHFRENSRYRAVRPKGTPDWLLIFTVDGSGVFRSPLGDYVAAPGDAVLIPAGVSHDYGLIQEGTTWELIYAHFFPRPEWTTLLQWPEIPSGIRVIRCKTKEDAGRVEQAMQGIRSVLFSGRPQHGLEALNRLEQALLLLAQQNPAEEFTSWDTRVQSALDFLADAFPEIRALEIVSRQVGLSISQFSRIFKAQTGETLSRRIEKMRLGRARDYLEMTSSPVAEIASRVGYDDPLYFSKRFKLEFGLSPREFRKKCTDGPPHGVERDPDRNNF